MIAITRLRALVAGVLLLAVAGCNTVQGAGQDIESVGRKGEEVLKGD